MFTVFRYRVKNVSNILNQLATINRLTHNEISGKAFRVTVSFNQNVNVRIFVDLELLIVMGL